MPDEQPVTSRTRYAVHTQDLDKAFEVDCDDIREENGYIRFYVGGVPTGIIPITQLIAIYRVEATA